MLLDNKNHGKVIDELKLHLTKDARLSILTGAFSVFGFSALKAELEKIDSLRMLLSDECSVAISGVAGGTGEIDLKNNLDLQRVSKECADWVRKRVDVRSLSGAPIAQNIRFAETGRPIKVLSLFFIDSVEFYRQYDDDGHTVKGKYALMFEEEYRKLAKLADYQTNTGAGSPDFGLFAANQFKRANRARGRCPNASECAVPWVDGKPADVKIN